MPQVCSIHSHEKYPQIEKQLRLGLISEFDAAQELSVSIDTIRKHLIDCRAIQEIEVEGNPYEKTMLITQQVLDRIIHALEIGEESYKGEKLSHLLRVATDTLTKLDKMGRTFVPISEKTMNEYRQDYEELLQFLSSAELSMESRNLIDEWLEAGEEEDS